MKQEGVISQQYILQRELNKFADHGMKAATGEVDKLQKWCWFQKIDVLEFMEEEKFKAMKYIMSLTQNRNGKIKGQMVYNVKPTCDCLSLEESTSTSVSLESVITTLVIGAHEEHNNISYNVLNAFFQTVIPYGNKRVIMKVTGVMLDLLV